MRFHHLALGAALLFALCDTAYAQPAFVQAFSVGTTASGSSATTSSFTAIGANDALICDFWTSSGPGLNSVTDNGSGDTYSTAALSWNASGKVYAFWGITLSGGPTSLTLNFASGSEAPFVRCTEYSNVGSVNITGGPTEIDSANPSISITTTAANTLVYEISYTNSATQPTAPSGFTVRQNHFSSTGEVAADNTVASAGTVTATWTTASVQNVLFAIAFAPPIAGGAATPLRSLMGVGQ